MSDLYELHDMEPQEAKEYILLVMAQLRQKKQELGGLKEQKTMWETRVAMAQEKEAPLLMAQAQEKVSEVTQAITQNEIDSQELEVGIEYMKNQLKSPEMATPRLVDADALLEEMNMLSGGEPDKITPEIQKLDADAALAALKAKMTQN